MNRALWRWDHVGPVGTGASGTVDVDVDGGEAGLLRALSCPARILLPKLRGPSGAEIEALRQVGEGMRRQRRFRARRGSGPLEAGGML